MSILKYKDPKTGEFKRINPYKADLSFVGKDGIVVNKDPNSEMVEISGSGLVQDPAPGKNVTGATLTLMKQFGKTDWATAFKRDSEALVANASTNDYVGYGNRGEIYAKITTNSDYSVTNRKYVDDNYVAKVKFTNLEQALYGYILDTTKEAYADLDSAVLKDSVALGDNVYPIADKTRALVTRIEGKTTKMVQLLKNGDFSQGTDNWLKYSEAVNNISFEVVGNSLEISALVGGTSGDWYLIQQTGMQTSVVGHKYLILVTAKIMQGEGITGFNYEGYAALTPLVKIDNTNLYYAFITAATAYDWYGLKPSGTKAVGDKWSFSNCQCFNLTAMNREDITTVEQFKAEFPDIYPYENGNIYPAKISGVKFYEKQDKSGEQASVTLPETYDLHGIGDFKDYLEITKNENNELYTLKKVQNIGSVDLGTLYWQKTSVFYVNEIDFIKSSSYGLCKEFLCIPYDKVVDYNRDFLETREDKNLYFRFSKESSYKDMTAIEFKAAMNGVMLYYALATPVETVIATNLTYEQVTAIRHNGGLIEVVGNTNKAYAKPTIKNTVVYRLTAANTAEA